MFGEGVTASRTRMASLLGHIPLGVDRTTVLPLHTWPLAPNAQSGAVDGQQLARTPGALPFFLRNLLPETDFYIKYHSLQALRGLVAACPSLVQEVPDAGWLPLRGCTDQ